jgi:hypothetical protein
MKKLQVATIACRDEAGLRFFYKKLSALACRDEAGLGSRISGIIRIIPIGLCAYSTMGMTICFNFLIPTTSLHPSLVFNLHNNNKSFLYGASYLYLHTYFEKNTSLLESNEFFPIGFPSLLVYLFQEQFFFSTNITRFVTQSLHLAKLNPFMAVHHECISIK